ncbi:MAG: ACP phosphodiesterase [Pseudomonadota bacterium]|nr:ACP phosphodiesterase [Pseudomonadota bacterium]
MNFLAHLYLAGDDPQALVGGLMGDFVKGRIETLEGLTPGLRQGIVLHRRVDAFTDAHPLVGRSRGRVQPRFRRYAGILVDVYYDHFLARHWQRYAAEPLPAFTARVYRVLAGHYALMPPRMQRSVACMIRDDWLGGYRQLAGVGRALRGIEGRLRRESRLGEAVADLEMNYPALEQDFISFFPLLCAFVAEQTAPPPPPARE